jgi:hypothetical protein
MKKVFIILGLVLANHAWAINTDQLYNCKINKNDVFDRVERVSAGPYKGRCINTQNYRSVRAMSEAQLNDFSLNKTSQYFHVANFRHLDHFWVAEISLNDILAVDFQIVPLADALPMHHGQLRFRFKPTARPIKLISQEKNHNERKVIYLKTQDGNAQDFIVALFGAREISHDKTAFNPLLGISIFGKSKYAISYAFQSLYDGDQWALDANKTIKQFHLNISKWQINDLLKNAREFGDKNRMDDMYDLFVDNCLHFVFKILAKTVNYEEPVHFGRKVSQTFSPLFILEKMNLIESKKDYILLRSEFPNDIEKIEETVPFLDE